MNTDEIKAVAALCYLEMAWVVKPEAVQAIYLCERFLASITEQAEPVGEVDGFGMIWWKKRPLQGTKLYAHPIPEPAPHEQKPQLGPGCGSQTSQCEVKSSSKSHVGAAPLPEDVREMVERLRFWFGREGGSAADMLERLAANQIPEMPADQYTWFAAYCNLKKESERLAARTAIPDGYALVPREPTQEMFDAFFHGAEQFSENYKAMIAAGERK